MQNTDETPTVQLGETPHRAPLGSSSGNTLQRVPTVDPLGTVRTEPAGLQKDNFDKNIQTRQRTLLTVLAEYKDALDTGEFVSEMITHCQNSGLDQHKGLIISAIMKKCPSGTRLGRRVRASLKDTKHKLQAQQSGTGSGATLTPSWNDNMVAAQYLKNSG